MALEATGSRYTIKTNYLIAAACMAFALWFLYDGWKNKEFKQEHTIINEETGQQRPDVTLQLNRTWLPIVCGLALAYFVVSAVRLRTKKMTADDKGLALSSGPEIPYNSIRQIDKRFFEKEGHFTIEYQVTGRKKSLKLSDRHWDGLGLLLDELIKQTGAAPADSLEEPKKIQEQPAKGQDQKVEEAENNEAES